MGWRMEEEPSQGISYVPLHAALGTFAVPDFAEQSTPILFHLSSGTHCFPLSLIWSRGGLLL